MAVVPGFVEESPQHRFYNTAFYAEGGRIVHLHRKVYLPTYGLFDEQRYFAAGERFEAFDTARFGRVGILICEDFWHLSAAAIMQAEEVDLLICPANSPGRGVDGPRIRTAETYEHLVEGLRPTDGRGGDRGQPRGIRGRAVLLGRQHGRSGPTAARSPRPRMLDEALTLAAFDPADLRRQRLITPLARDERLLLTIEELHRIKRHRYESLNPARSRSDDQRRTGRRPSSPASSAAEIRRAGFERAVVGLSGGIDSSVVTFLAARALGPENVLAVTMPYKTSSEATRRDSQAVIEQLGVRTVDVPITGQIDAYFAQFPDASQMRLANKCARERMTVLYDQSAAFDGPGAGHQQQERAAAGLRHAVRRHGLGDQPDRRSLQDATLSTWPPIWACPSAILAKTAHRRPVGRADRRGRVGLHLRRGRSAAGPDGRSPLAAGGTDRRPASRRSSSIAWRRMIRRNHYKRRMPVIAKLSHRTMDRDFRYARDWGT